MQQKSIHIWRLWQQNHNAASHFSKKPWRLAMHWNSLTATSLHAPRHAKPRWDLIARESVHNQLYTWCLAMWPLPMLAHKRFESVQVAVAKNHQIVTQWQIAPKLRWRWCYLTSLSAYSSFCSNLSMFDKIDDSAWKQVESLVIQGSVPVKHVVG